MADIDEAIEKLQNNAKAIVDIPQKSGEFLRYNCLFIKKEAPVFELLFPPEAWEEDDLQLGSDCNLLVEHHGQTVNLIARLNHIVGERRLALTGIEAVHPKTLREYFRVAISTPIEASYISNLKENTTQSWKMSGTTLDLSGSGVLAMFSSLPPSKQQIQIIITIPESDKPIACLADVIRSYKIRHDRYQVAFHFAHLTSKIRDQIMSCCFQEQRRQLRGKTC